MKIAYATTYDVRDRASWPRRHLGLYGAGQNMAKLLQGRGRALALAAWQHYRQHLSWNAAQQNAWGYLQELRLNADRGNPSRADIAHSP